MLGQRILYRTLAAFLLFTLLAASFRGVAAANRWPDERAAGAFHCHADFELQQFDRLWLEMSRLQQDLHRTLLVPPADEPIHLFLFEHKATYEEYLQLHFPQVPYRRALFIKDHGPGMVFAHRNKDFETDVRHESTHALLHAVLPVVPLWLDEGLAEYFELPRADRGSNSPHLSKVRWAAWFAQVPSIERLEQLGDLSHMGPTEYRHAWAWVHFMLHGPAEAHDELVSFLDSIRSHAPPGVLSERLRKRMPDLNKRFLAHFRNWKAE